jgi:phosphatidylglycerol:prolipoprotein diacylglycerol transferase
MCPEFFHIGPIPIRAYGLMLAISFFLGVWYVKYVTSRDNKPFEPFLTIAYIMIFGGILGARLTYVVLHLHEFADNWVASFNPFSSEHFGIAGLNMYGGVLTAVIGTLLYCRWKKMSVLEVFDYFSPTLGLGLALARIGCFLNGCCFGTPTDLPWGVSFPPGSIPYSVFQDAHLHPAQLYSSLYGLGLFLILHMMMKRKRFVGQLIALLFMIEAVFRFAIEYVRFYEEEMYFRLDGLHPTYNQVISLLLFLLGLGIYIRQRRRTLNKQ